MITTILSDFSKVLVNLKNINYQGTLNDLHKKLSASPGYKFSDYYELNNELLDFYKQLKPRISLNIFTTGLLAKYVDEQKLLDPMFERIYVSNEMGLSKDAENSYRWITKDLGRTPEEILFIDDQMPNIAAARQAGLQTVVFYSTTQVISEINHLLS